MAQPSRFVVSHKIFFDMPSLKGDFFCCHLGKMRLVSSAVLSAVCVNHWL